MPPEGEEREGEERLWDGLAPYYDLLFPPGRTQLDFLKTVLGRARRPVRRVLDIGCATGGYTLALAELGFEVTGVDLSAEMVRLARLEAERSATARGLTRGGPEPAAAVRPPRFLVRDMTDLDGLPAPGEPPFDAVVCLGNTLSGCLSALELGRALGEMARVLAEDGLAVLQVVNYDRLGATGELRLPPITVEVPGEPGSEGPGRKLVLTRLYVPRSDGLVSFSATLTDSDSGRPFLRSETLLRPITRDELVAVAELAFHGEVRVWGDFLFSVWTEASPATVVVAEKVED